MKKIAGCIFIIIVALACTKKGPLTTNEPKAEKTNTIHDADVMLNDRQIRLANIKTAKAGVSPIGQTLSVSGRFVVNEHHSKLISSRTTGRIEKLYVKETGNVVRQGEPLYSIYSETLMTLQQEYLLAHEQYILLGETEKRYKTILASAENKLLLYGMTKAQISKLTDQQSIQQTVTFLAPASGVVTDVGVSEGQYVPEGGLLYKLEDLSSLWVEAALYPDETSFVKVGDEVTVIVDGSKNSITATVDFLSPEYQYNSQIIMMRARIDNKNSIFKPGQQVQINLTHSTRNAISIPVDAVIRDQKGTHVYKVVGNNTFRPVMVKTGLENFDQVEITDGIVEGDTLAVSGAYLLYSELILRKGTDPMASHHH